MIGVAVDVVAPKPENIVDDVVFVFSGELATLVDHESVVIDIGTEDVVNVPGVVIILLVNVVVALALVVVKDGNFGAAVVTSSGIV